MSPSPTSTYWEPKLERNRARDAKTIEALSATGWKSLIVWECETREVSGLALRIKTFLRKK